MDYRTRWQQKRRKKHLVQLALIPVVIVGLTLIGLLVHKLTGGTTTWSYTGPEDTIASPTISGNVVLTTFSGGQVACFRLVDGTPIWPSPFYQPQNISHSASVASGIAVVNSDYGGIFALSMTDGHLLWDVDIEHLLSAAPAVTEDSIYVATSEGHVEALELKSGMRKSSVELADASFSAQPALCDGVLVLGTRNGTIIGVNPETGAEVWPRRTVEATLLSPISNVNGLAACGSDQGKLYVIEPKSGAIRFTVEASGILRSPAVADADALYVCDSEGWLYKYRLADGSRVFAVRIASAVDEGPFLAGEYVLCLIDGERVVEVHKANGKVAHTWRGFDDATHLSAGSDYIVIGTSSGTLHAVKTAPE